MGWVSPTSPAASSRAWAWEGLLRTNNLKVCRDKVCSSDRLNKAWVHSMTCWACQIPLLPLRLLLSTASSSSLLASSLPHMASPKLSHRLSDKFPDKGALLPFMAPAKQRTEIALSSIRSVRITQTFGQRLFDVGNVELFSAGDVAEIAIRNMPRPGRIRAIAAARNLDLLPQR